MATVTTDINCPGVEKGDIAETLNKSGPCVINMLRAGVRGALREAAVSALISGDHPLSLGCHRVVHGGAVEQYTLYAK